jgi:two-component system cell cycle response regulator
MQPSSGKILVVDDEPAEREKLRRLLEGRGFEVRLAADGREAISTLLADPPHLVLLDMVMPGLSGLEVCRLIKARQDLGFIPIIIITGRTDSEKRLEALRIGADDYVFKPPEENELLARMEALLRIKALQDKAQSTLKQAEDKSLIDSETGIYNRRYLEMRLHDEFKRAERYHEPLSCMEIELAGNAEIMKPAAEQIRSSLRDFDVVTRSNERRFTVILPRTHFTGALAVAHRLWKNLALKLPATSRPLITMGVAFFPHPEVHSAQDLYAQARHALENAHGAGGNQICLYQHTSYFCRPEIGELH